MRATMNQDRIVEAHLRLGGQWDFGPCVDNLLRFNFGATAAPPTRDVTTTGPLETLPNARALDIAVWPHPPPSVVNL